MEKTIYKQRELGSFFNNFKEASSMGMSALFGMAVFIFSIEALYGITSFSQWKLEMQILLFLSFTFYTINNYPQIIKHSIDDKSFWRIKSIILKASSLSFIYIIGLYILSIIFQRYEGDSFYFNSNEFYPTGTIIFIVFIIWLIFTFTWFNVHVWQNLWVIFCNEEDCNSLVIFDIEEYDDFCDTLIEHTCNCGKVHERRFILEGNRIQLYNPEFDEEEEEDNIE